MWLCEGPWNVVYCIESSIILAVGPHPATHDRTEPHRTRTGPIPDKKCLIVSLRRVLRVELKGVKRRVNYSQSTKGMNSSRRLWWVGFEVGMDRKWVKSVLRNAERKMWNRKIKCGMTLIGRGDKPRDHCHSTVYHTDLSTVNAVKCRPAVRKMISSYQRRQNSFFWPWMQSTERHMLGASAVFHDVKF